jgi:hypothetical protein
MGIFEKMFGGSKAERVTTGEDEPEMGIQEHTPEIKTPGQGEPEITTVNGALAELNEEEKDDRRREEQIEEIKRTPTIN